MAQLTQMESPDEPQQIINNGNQSPTSTDLNENSQTDHQPNNSDNPDNLDNNVIRTTAQTPPITEEESRQNLVNLLSEAARRNPRRELHPNLRVLVSHLFREYCNSEMLYHIVGIHDPSITRPGSIKAAAREIIDRYTNPQIYPPDIPFGSILSPQYLMDSYTLGTDPAITLRSFLLEINSVVNAGSYVSAYIGPVTEAAQYDDWKTPDGNYAFMLVMLNKSSLLQLEGARAFSLPDTAPLDGPNLHGVSRIMLLPQHLNAYRLGMLLNVRLNKRALANILGPHEIQIPRCVPPEYIEKIIIDGRYRGYLLHRLPPELQSKVYKKEGYVDYMRGGAQFQRTMEINSTIGSIVL